MHVVVHGGGGGRVVLNGLMGAWGDNAHTVAHGAAGGCRRGENDACVVIHASCDDDN